ncbi:hypothetical protein ACRQ1B_28815 [Rhizobium panacihumi]|uniref:hypothetical protein n=1 Tax=Rhizobium panacihumi TaxID=2008450 RepID=UPI003D7A5FF1
MTTRLIQDLHAGISRRDWSAVETAANALRDESDKVRRALAATDFSSLPADYPTLRMVEDRMEQLSRCHPAPQTRAMGDKVTVFPTSGAPYEATIYRDGATVYVTSETHGVEEWITHRAPENHVPAKELGQANLEGFWSHDPEASAVNQWYSLPATLKSMWTNAAAAVLSAAARHARTTDRIWNVAADDENGHSQIMCVDWQTREDAQKSVDHYVENYVGKPYPNGKGHYSINNVRLIREDGQ